MLKEIRLTKLKPLLIKSEPDREYVQHIHSDDNLPDVPEENFLQKREITVNSYRYSDTISSDSSSDDDTITADNISSASRFEEISCMWETDSKGIEATLHQIASGLQTAAEGYLTLASHISKIAPYELPQIIAQIPAPPMNIPMPIRKALTVDGECKVVDYLLHGKYEITTLLGLSCRTSTISVRMKYILLLKEKEDLEDPNTDKRKIKLKTMLN